MNLEEELTAALADEIAKEIDFEIVSSFLVDAGWTKVVLKPMTGETSKEIDLWLVHNCKDQHQTCGLVWLFKDERDATWFKLRWVGQ